MGCVAFNTHVAFWTMGDNITQVKTFSKNGQTFSRRVKSRAGAALTGSTVLSNLLVFTFLSLILSHLFTPVCVSLNNYKVMQAHCKSNNG